MSKSVRWFLDKLKDPKWVDRPQEELPEWLVDENVDTPVIPQPSQPQAPQAVDMSKDSLPGVLGEGMDPMKEPVGEENVEGSMVTPFSKKMRYMASMRGKQNPAGSYLGGDYGD